MEALVLGHEDFRVCVGLSRYASQAQRVILYECRCNRLDNRKICVAVDNQGAKLLIQIVDTSMQGRSTSEPYAVTPVVQSFAKTA